MSDAADPTEGGVATGLSEIARTANVGLIGGRTIGADLTIDIWRGMSDSGTALPTKRTSGKPLTTAIRPNILNKNG
jgi:hypothetical protein